MDTEFVNTVIAVIDESSIANAARKLGLTPGAVALRIKVLENELGTALIGRAGRNIAPTAAAKRLLPSLRQLAADAASLRRIGAASEGRDDSLCGELRLGAISTASAGILPSLLKDMAHAYPQVDIFIEPGTSLELYKRVLDGVLDAAVIIEPPTALRKAETFTQWTSEPLIVIAPSELAGCDPLELIASQPFIRYDRRNWGGQIVDNYLKSEAVITHERYELDSLEAIVAMVSAGLGVSVIPDWKGPRPAGCKIAEIPLPPSAPERVIGLYHRNMSMRQDLINLVNAAGKRLEL